MSVNVGIEDPFQKSHNGAFQSFRPVKAQMMHVQRSNSIMGTEPCDNNIRMPSTSWSDSTSQNIQLRLTVRKFNKYSTYIVFTLIPTYLLTKSEKLWMTAYNTFTFYVLQYVILILFIFSKIWL